MHGIDECSCHNMPRGMEDGGCSKSFVLKSFGSNAITCPSPVCQNTSYGHLNSSMPHTIGGGMIRGGRQ